MNWTDEPATWKQLKYLKQVGYKADRPLTKSEASNLIRGYGGRIEEQPVTAGNDNTRQIAAPEAAYRFHVTVEKAKAALAGAKGAEIKKAQDELAMAVAKRQEFWINTCRDAGKVLVPSMNAHELYQKHGCCFDAPSPKDVQYILDALDSAMPFWDREHPELFYKTLELNFPELLRRH